MNDDRFSCLSAQTNQVAAFSVLDALDGKLTPEEMLAGVSTPNTR